MTDVEILAFSSSASAGAEAKGCVFISGSYGGEYNAYHAAKWGIRGVVLNDAGVGRNRAGTKGLDYLDRIDLAAATANCWTCHIADGEHMLEYGVISYVNEAATALGCKVGQTVRKCAELMKSANICETVPPEISGGKRFVLRNEPGFRKVLGLDAAPFLEDADAGEIAVTGSHAALFRGRPDNIVGPDVHAIFFNDAGLGMDGAGITRLPTLDERDIIAGAVSAYSAPMGDARTIYEDGVLSYVNDCAAAAGARPGMRLSVFIDTIRGNATGL